MPVHFSCESHPSQPNATSIVLREAKRLHRAALSDSLAISLPVLRRLLRAQAVSVRTLPELFRSRHTVQRKHILRTLAIEAGYTSWEGYRPMLPQLDAQALMQTFALDRGTATLKLWFSNEVEAQRFAAEHGGQTVRLAHQAVVLPLTAAGHGETMRQ